MFDFSLEPEESLIRDTARRFAEAELLARVRLHETNRAVDPAIVRRFSETGLDAVDLPERCGGQGAGTFAKALVLEELATIDAGAALALEAGGLAATALVEAGSEHLWRRLREGGGRAVVIEDVENRFHDDSGRVNGEHPWVPADAPALVLVLQGDGGWMVTDCILATPVAVCGLEAAGGSRVRLDGAPIVGRMTDPEALARCRARTRTAVAALLVGAARGAREYATRYAIERTAFGRPIAHHQAVAFLIADMATAIESARALVWRAAAAIDAGEDASWEAAVALAEAAEQALFVGPGAVQLLGGHGFMKDHPVEKWMRDIRALASLAGGRDEAELVAAALAPARDLSPLPSGRGRREAAGEGETPR